MSVSGKKVRVSVNMMAATSRVALLAIMLPASIAVSAQEAKPSGAAAGDEDIVVTATRVQRSGFTAPTPTTVLGEIELERRAPVNVAEVLNELPAFRPSLTPSTNPFLGSAQNIVDLRALGSARTLVLVDGRRHVPSTTSGTVDLNLIPSILVSRMEVVTGGASAAWGSDAVAGVVNVLLKDDLQGIEGNAQYGESHYGDDITYMGSLAAGTSFAGDRGHIVVAGEYSDNNGVGDQYTRDWGRESRGAVGNPNWRTNGQPAVIFGRGLRFANQTPGGLILSGPLAGTAFAPDGTPYQFGAGSVSDGNTMLGGNDNYGISPLQGALLKVPVTRYNGFARLDFDVTDSLNMFTEASYAKSEWESVGPNMRNPPGALTIRNDNPYLPASTRAAMAANNITSFSLGRYTLDIDRILPQVSNETKRFVGGLEGDFGGGWGWDAYYQYGENKYDLLNRNNRISANFNRAVDAVVNPANGQIVCRVNVDANPSNDDPTCVPLNPFGNGSVSPAAADYVTGDGTYVQKTKQHVAAFNLQGEPFSTWAGAVSLATGVEYRKESVDSVSDALSLARAFEIGNNQPIRGDYDVKEVYAETVIPLLADKPFADSFDLNAAVRLTDYSISGTVTTWKVGVTYGVNEQLRFRAARSRDIRAPNLAEIFTSSSASFTFITDPFRNVTGITPTFRQGNLTGLNPEKADTLTLGVVYQPNWLEGLRASVDYYNIDIKDQINTLTGQQIIDRCFQGASEFCSLVDRDASGALTGIRSPQLNLTQFKTAGIDVELAYRTPLATFASSLPGDIDFRLLANYVEDLISVDSAGRVDRAGQITAMPHWLWNGSITYNVGSFAGSLQGRYVGGGKINVLSVPNTATSANINEVDSTFYTNITAQYDLIQHDDGRRVQVYGVVNNLFDVGPPYPLNGPENGGVFHDLVGRTYRVGVRFKY